MGLREDAIRQYQDAEAVREAKAKKEREDAIARQVKNAKETVCRKFGLSECPEFTLTEQAGHFYPICSFEIDGVPFEYVLGNANLCVKVICPKCENSWLKSISVSTTDGKTDLSDLGHELSKEHGNCPADRPETPQPPPRPPVKTVEYAIGSYEQRLIEAIFEMVNDAVQNHEH